MFNGGGVAVSGQGPFHATSPVRLNSRPVRHRYVFAVAAGILLTHFVPGLGFSYKRRLLMNEASMPLQDDVLLAATGLVKTLGGNRVVDGIDLMCRSGEVLGLLGPNGAGKTTTLRMCYGFLRPDAGQIRIDGHDLAHDGDRARRALGVCTQDDTFDSEFTVRGNLIQTGRYYRPRQPDLIARIDALIERFG